MHIRTDLGCTPLTKFWIASKYGVPYKLNQKTNLGKYIFEQLGRPGTSVPENKYKDSIQLIITDRIYARGGVILSPFAQTLINRFVRDEVYSLFFSTVQVVQELDQTKSTKIKDAIDGFCNVHNLPEGVLAYETIKKAWYRERQKGKKLDYQWFKNN